MKKNTVIFFTFCGISLFLNLIFALSILSSKKQNDTAASYPLLSPRIFAENQNDILINFLTLRKKLRETVAPWGESFSFFFEYLPSGTSIGVNEKVEFKAASLIKLPVVMAYFHQKEHAPIQLIDSTVVLEQKDIDKGFGTLWQKGAGTNINLEEAARLAIVESDNTATMVLAHRVLQEHFDTVYNGLDIDFISAGDQEAIITAKQYTSILKALYFTSVLSKEHSQKILGLLTQTKFADKLPAGVEPGISIAHKVGILAGNIYQDCGIVYVPQRPYALCMFSKSDDLSAQTRMKAVSEAIYWFVSTVPRD